MPRVVPIETQRQAMRMMQEGLTQMEIHRSTGLSRPFIRKLAKQQGHQFPRNGVENRKQKYFCANSECGEAVYRSPSKLNKNVFCSESCYQKHLQSRKDKDVRPSNHLS